MNFRALQRRANKTTINEKTGLPNSKSRYGKSIGYGAPAAFLKRLDLKALSVTGTKLTPSLHIKAYAQTDMKKSHRVRLSLTNIVLATEENTFHTKDLHAGVEMASDSIRSYVNAGDLTFLFRSKGGIDELTAQADNLTKLLAKQ